MKKYALTGGIGTGKTFISKQFVDNGIPVFYADDEAKKLYSDPSVLEKLRSAFGNQLFSDGILDFKKMSVLIFGYPVQQKKLEQIIHPLVMDRFEKWASLQQAEIVMMETAILFEANLEKYFDKVIVVNASVPVRVARIRRRNPDLSESEILARIQAQMPQEEKCKRADEVIDHEIDI